MSVRRSGCKARFSDDRSHLNHIHRDVTQPLDRELRALAGRDRFRRNETAGDHDHAGFEIAAALGDMIGEPGQGGAGVFGGAFADKLAAEREPAGNADEVIGRDALWRSGDDATIPAILDDQRPGLGARIIGVTILDQLKGRQRRGDCLRDTLARPRRAGRPLARFRFRYAD